MFLNFNKPDRRILAVATLMVLIAMYFLYDDSALLSFDDDSSQPSIGVLSSLNNDVRFKFSKRFAWKTARNQESVRFGDSIFTGGNSKAKVQFNDGTSLEIQQNSLVVISKVDNQMKLDLRFGSFGGNLDGCIKVSIKGKQVDVCGDKSNVEITSDGEVNVKKGSVKVADKQIKAHVTDLLEWATNPPEDFSHSGNNRYLSLAWSSKKNYSRYRLQFSKDGKFKNLETQDLTQSLALETKNYPRKGEYMMRIQAEDVTGQEVAATKPVKIIFRDLITPKIMTPLAKQVFEIPTDADGDPLEASKVEITWEYNNPKAQYELELSNQADFSTVEIRRDTKAKAYQTPDLNPGDYFVRIREMQKERPWSAITPFEVKFKNSNKLEAPQLLTKIIKYSAPSKEKPVAQWQSKTPVQKYIVETSSTPEFRPEETSSFQVETTTAALKVSDPGKTYFRVSSISKKGRRSPASEVGTLLTKIHAPILNPVKPISTYGKTPEDQGEALNLDVSWSDLKVADSYEIEFSEDSRFKTKTKLRAPASVGKLVVPKPGEYHWRVRGLNAQGKPITRYSKPDTIKYDLKVPLSQPVLVEPLANMTLFFQKKTSPYIWLEWKSVRQAKTYSVEVSTDPQFSRIVYQKVVSSPRHLIKENVGNGKLYWRTQAMGDDGRISHWSEPRLMTIWSGTPSTDRMPAGRKNNVPLGQRR